MDLQSQKCSVALRPPLLLELQAGRTRARGSHPAPALIQVLLVPAAPMSPLSEELQGHLIFRSWSAVVPLL